MKKIKLTSFYKKFINQNEKKKKGNIKNLSFFFCQEIFIILQSAICIIQEIFNIT